MFRAIGATAQTFDAASKISGLVITATVMYTGYLIQKPHMHPWFVWLYWVDPLAYGFEALLANEFHNKIIPCIGDNLIPSGPSYLNSAFQSCSGVGGAIEGEVIVTGDNYLQSLSYSHAHVWRNLGIVWAWWALYVAITVVATSRWRSPSENGPSLLIPREQLKMIPAKPPVDEESQTQEKNSEQSSPAITLADGEENRNSDISKSLIRNTSVFTWRNLTYTVKTSSGDRVLVDNVQGWVKPGMLGALMGSSGAGKTTLLDVLAQRKTEGTIHGSIMVDGRPLPVSFQRSAGYCEQLDVHEPLATVREALEFSALLRQPRDVSREEKLSENAYVTVTLAPETGFQSSHF